MATPKVLLILALAALTLPLAAYAGGKSHGGDGRAIEFTAIGRDLVSFIKSENRRHFWTWSLAGQLKASALNKAIEQVVVFSSTDDALFVINGKQKDAISDPETRVIAIHAGRWDAINNNITRKTAIVAHEYAVQLGLEVTDDYRLSSQLVQAMWGSPQVNQERETRINAFKHKLYATQAEIRDEVDQLVSDRDKALSKERAEIKRIQTEADRLTANRQELVNKMHCMDAIPVEAMFFGLTGAENSNLSSAQFIKMGIQVQETDSEGNIVEVKIDPVLVQSADKKTAQNIARFCEEFKKNGGVVPENWESLLQAD